MLEMTDFKPTQRGSVSWLTFSPMALAPYPLSFCPFLHQPSWRPGGGSEVEKGRQCSVLLWTMPGAVVPTHMTRSYKLSAPRVLEIRRGLQHPRVLPAGASHSSACEPRPLCSERPRGAGGLAVSAAVQTRGDPRTYMCLLLDEVLPGTAAPPPRDEMPLCSPPSFTHRFPLRNNNIPTQLLRARPLGPLGTQGYKDHC